MFHGLAAGLEWNGMGCLCLLEPKMEINGENWDQDLREVSVVGSRKRRVKEEGRSSILSRNG